MSSIRTKIAAGVTLASLGGLTAVALSAGATPSVTSGVPAASTEVRTQVSKQVVHRSRRAHGAPSLTADSRGHLTVSSAATGTPAAAAPAAASSSGPSSTGSAQTAADDNGRNRGPAAHGRNRGAEHQPGADDVADDHAAGDDDGAAHDAGDDHGAHDAGDDRGAHDAGDDHGGGHERGDD